MTSAQPRTPRAAMFLAAFTSACSAKPRDVQRNVAWSDRFFLLMCPHGSTPGRCTPDRRTPPVSRPLPPCSDRTNQLGESPEYSITRSGLRSRSRARMPVRFSRAMPRPVRSASVTMRLAMTWLVSAANQASLRNHLRSSRFADLVPFAPWSFRRRARLRCQTPVHVFSRVPVPVVGRRDVHESLIYAGEPVRAGGGRGRSRSARTGTVCRPNGCAADVRPEPDRAWTRL